MSHREQELEDLKERYDILILTVHDMNDLIHELREENQELKRILEEIENGGE
tara:strand:+ start:10846 stop:11001 length:156 start_codon:yes stop_codon:yes gene_type:complete